MFLDAIKNIDHQMLPNDWYLVRKHLWDYEEALAFQLMAMNFVQENPSKKILICCSHPHCFTMGRGLQKANGKIVDGLIEFDPNFIHLPYPLHYIKRGGGLTFHYPGQWVLYPILNLGRFPSGLKGLLNFCFGSVQDILRKNFMLDSLLFDQKILGLWCEQKKLASFGLAVDHLVSTHGLALNLEKDEQMFSSLRTLHPCGLPGNHYICVQDALKERSISWNIFQNAFESHVRSSLI